MVWSRRQDKEEEVKKKVYAHCPACKKSFNLDEYIRAVIDCPKYTCGLKFGTGKVTEKINGR
jgi:ribosomal protein L37AE/L43A